MIVGRAWSLSARANASRRSARSCPPRSRIAGDELGVLEVGDDAPDVVRGRAVARQALAQLRGRAAQQSLVLGVGHRVDALAQRLAAVAREQLAEQAPVLHRDRLPAGGLEHRADATGGDVGHDPVERLPVEVDDPQHLAEARDDRIDERLPDRALVELGIAQQRDVAPALGDLEVAGDVAVGERAPERRGGPDPHGAGREVDGVGVLRAARVALQATERAQLGQVRGVEPAEEVVDRVQDGRGMRLHRDAVGRPEMLEVERRHDADHRGRRGLMAADLHARGRGADAVGVVHDARREPEHAALHRVEHVERVRGWGRRDQRVHRSSLHNLPLRRLQDATDRHFEPFSLTILACLTWTTSTTPSSGC